MKPRNVYLSLGVVSGVFLLVMFGLAIVPAAAHEHSCPASQEYQCHPVQECGWGDWNNGRCPAFGECQERSMGHGHWEHRHYVCYEETECGCVPVEVPPAPVAPAVDQSAPPAQFVDPGWTGSLEPCVGVTGSLEGAIHLISYDEERLYVTLEHNGFFDAEVITHAAESESLFLPGCIARNYYRSTCNVQRLSGVGILSFTITGTRDFRVIAIPELVGDPGITRISIVNHAVDYSGESSGRVLDMRFFRTQALQGCPVGWLTQSFSR